MNRDVCLQARWVSAFTHFDTAAGDCCAAALCVGGDRNEAMSAAQNAAGGLDLFSGDLVPSVDAVEATRCALFCFTEWNSVRDVIELAVSLGGDTDTIASIAGGLAGIFQRIDNVPKE